MDLEAKVEVLWKLADICPRCMKRSVGPSRTTVPRNYFRYCRHCERELGGWEKPGARRLATAVVEKPLEEGEEMRGLFDEK